MAPPRLGRLPMPFTIGNDICHIPRILKILREGAKGPRFVRRVLAPEEIEQPWTKPLLRIVLDPAPKDAAGSSETMLLRAAQFMAGRFAVKEAVVKAHPHRKLTWHRIVIDRPHVEVLAAPLEESTATKTTTKTTKVSQSSFLPPPPPKKEEEEEEEEGEKLKKDGNPPLLDSEPGFSRPPVALIKGDGRYADTRASVSISHDGDYASAVCLGCYEEPVWGGGGGGGGGDGAE
ncbi:hypothetical protein F4809DRAFT_465876 [Biscogniauxia mediterranea]|nr:hypothetical protein F4809DRAFT_465876 [Biscogniauxia mediterranea]